MTDSYEEACRRVETALTKSAAHEWATDRVPEHALVWWIALDNESWQSRVVAMAPWRPGEQVRASFAHRQLHPTKRTTTTVSTPTCTEVEREMSAHAFATWGELCRRRPEVPTEVCSGNWPVWLVCDDALVSRDAIRVAMARVCVLYDLDPTEIRLVGGGRRGGGDGTDRPPTTTTSPPSPLSTSFSSSSPTPSSSSTTPLPLFALVRPQLERLVAYETAKPDGGSCVDAYTDAIRRRCPPPVDVGCDLVFGPPDAAAAAPPPPPLLSVPGGFANPPRAYASFSGMRPNACECCDGADLGGGGGGGGGAAVAAISASHGSFQVLHVTPPLVASTTDGVASRRKPTEPGATETNREESRPPSSANPAPTSTPTPTPTPRPHVRLWVAVQDQEYVTPESGDEDVKRYDTRLRNLWRGACVLDDAVRPPVATRFYSCRGDHWYAPRASDSKETKREPESGSMASGAAGGDRDLLRCVYATRARAAIGGGGGGGTAADGKTIGSDEVREFTDGRESLSAKVPLAKRPSAVMATLYDIVDAHCRHRALWDARHRVDTSLSSSSSSSSSSSPMLAEFTADELRDEREFSARVSPDAVTHVLVVLGRLIVDAKVRAAHLTAYERYAASHGVALGGSGSGGSASSLALAVVPVFLGHASVQSLMQLKHRCETVAYGREANDQGLGYFGDSKLVDPIIRGTMTRVARQVLANFTRPCVRVAVTSGPKSGGGRGGGGGGARLRTSRTDWLIVPGYVSDRDPPPPLLSSTEEESTAVATATAAAADDDADAVPSLVCVVNRNATKTYRIGWRMQTTTTAPSASLRDESALHMHAVDFDPLATRALAPTPLDAAQRRVAWHRLQASVNALVYMYRVHRVQAIAVAPLDRTSHLARFEVLREIARAIAATVARELDACLRDFAAAAAAAEVSVPLLFSSSSSSPPPPSTATTAASAPSAASVPSAADVWRRVCRAGGAARVWTLTLARVAPAMERVLEEMHAHLSDYLTRVDDRDAKISDMAAVHYLGRPLALSSFFADRPTSAVVADCRADLLRAFSRCDATSSSASDPLSSPSLASSSSSRSSSFVSSLECVSEPSVWPLAALPFSACRVPPRWRVVPASADSRDSLASTPRPTQAPNDTVSGDSALGALQHLAANRALLSAAAAAAATGSVSRLNSVWSLAIAVSFAGPVCLAWPVVVDARTARRRPTRPHDSKTNAVGAAERTPGDALTVARWCGVLTGTWSDTGSHEFLERMQKLAPASVTVASSSSSSSSSKSAPTTTTTTTKTGAAATAAAAVATKTAAAVATRPRPSRFVWPIPTPSTWPALDAWRRSALGRRHVLRHHCGVAWRDRSRVVDPNEVARLWVDGDTQLFMQQLVQFHRVCADLDDADADDDHDDAGTEWRDNSSSRDTVRRHGLQLLYTWWHLVRNVWPTMVFSDVVSTTTPPPAPASLSLASPAAAPPPPPFSSPPPPSLSSLPSSSSSSLSSSLLSSLTSTPVPSPLQPTRSNSGKIAMRSSTSAAAAAASRPGRRKLAYEWRADDWAGQIAAIANEPQDATIVLLRNASDTSLRHLGVAIAVVPPGHDASYFRRSEPPTPRATEEPAPLVGSEVACRVPASLETHPAFVPNLALELTCRRYDEAPTPDAVPEDWCAAERIGAVRAAFLGVAPRTVKTLAATLHAVPATATGTAASTEFASPDAEEAHHRRMAHQERVLRDASRGRLALRPREMFLALRMREFAESVVGWQTLLAAIEQWPPTADASSSSSSSSSSVLPEPLSPASVVDRMVRHFSRGWTPSVRTWYRVVNPGAAADRRATEVVDDAPSDGDAHTRRLPISVMAVSSSSSSSPSSSSSASFPSSSSSSSPGLPYEEKRKTRSPAAAPERKLHPVYGAHDRESTCFRWTLLLAALDRIAILPDPARWPAPASALPSQQVAHAIVACIDQHNETVRRRETAGSKRAAQRHVRELRAAEQARYVTMAERDDAVLRCRDAALERLSDDEFAAYRAATFLMPLQSVPPRVGGGGGEIGGRGGGVAAAAASSTANLPPQRAATATTSRQSPSAAALAAPSSSPILLSAGGGLGGGYVGGGGANEGLAEGLHDFLPVLDYGYASVAAPVPRSIGGGGGSGGGVRGPRAPAPPTPSPTFLRGNDDVKRGGGGYATRRDLQEMDQGEEEEEEEDEEEEERQWALEQQYGYEEAEEDARQQAEWGSTQDRRVEDNAVWEQDWEEPDRGEAAIGRDAGGGGGGGQGSEKLQAEAKNGRREAAISGLEALRTQSVAPAAVPITQPSEKSRDATDEPTVRVVQLPSPLPPPSSV